MDENFDKNVIKLLSDATTDADINETFDQSGITDITRKKEYLLEAKGLLSFYSPKYRALSPEEQYEHEKALFLHGKGRELNRIFSKLDV